jgi:hypothetical protein
MMERTMTNDQPDPRKTKWTDLVRQRFVALAYDSDAIDDLEDAEVRNILQHDIRAPTSNGRAAEAVEPIVKPPPPTDAPQTAADGIPHTQPPAPEPRPQPGPEVPRANGGAGYKVIADTKATLQSSTAAAPPADIGTNTQPQGRLVLTMSKFLDGLAQSDYVIDGLLKRGFFYSFTAMTGGGKTAIALAIAELASNRKRRRRLGNHDVEHVRVLYIACENAEDVRERLIGMESKMDFDRADLDMFVIDKVFDLEKNMERIRKEVEEFGGNIGLVIIDTSAAMFQGADENNNPQMINHAKVQRRLCELPGRPCVVALNHPTKGAATPEQLLPRGGGGYLNETDGNFTAWAYGERLSRFHWTGKLRGPDFEPIVFRLPTIFSTKLADAKGRLMPTVMAEVATDAQVIETEEKAKFQETRLLTAMLNRPNGSLTEWAEDCGWMNQGKPGEVAQPNKSLVRRVMKRLTDTKRAEKIGNDYTLTRKAKDAAKKGAADGAGKAADGAGIVSIVSAGDP